MGRHVSRKRLGLRELGKELEARRSAISAALSGRNVQFGTGRRAIPPTPAQRAALTLAIIRNS